MTRSKKFPALACAALALLLGSRVSTAQVSAKDTALARSLFRDARKLMEAKQYPAACAKLEESQRLDPGIGTQFNLADCWERLGKTASAWALFLDVTAATRAAGQSEREAVARGRAEALEGRLSRLQLRVEERDPKLSITRDAAELGRASWNSEFPVDPGTTVLEAKAPGKQSWTKQVTIPSTAGVTTVVVPALAPTSDASASASTEAEAETPATSNQDTSTVADATTAKRTPGGVQRAAAYGLGGLGVVGIAAGSYFLIRYNSKNSEAKSICPSGFNCAGTDQERHDAFVEDARSAAPWVYVGFGGGAAALVAGAVLYFTAAKPAEVARQSPTWIALPMVGPKHAGAAVTGQF